MFKQGTWEHAGGPGGLFFLSMYPQSSYRLGQLLMDIFHVPSTFQKMQLLRREEDKKVLLTSLQIQGFSAESALS
jgi:hypothetical protein